MSKRYLRPMFCPSCGAAGREKGAVFNISGMYDCKVCKVRYSVTIVKEQK